jgi:Sulfatase
LIPARSGEPPAIAGSQTTSSAPFLSPAAGRDALIALSLANVCYLRVWTELLTYQRVNTYLMDLPPGPPAMLAAMANVVLLGAVLWLAVTLVRRSGSPRLWTFTECTFLLFLALPLNGLRAVMTHFSDLFKSTLFEVLGTRGVMLLGLTLGVLGLAAVIFYHHKLAGAVAGMFAVLSPFVAVTFGQAVWKITQYDTREYANLPPEPMLPVAKPQRAVWIVCDEWDYRLTFDDRDRSISLPAIDKLRSETMFADHAMPPGLETPVSLPAYLSGSLLKRDVFYDGPRDLKIWHADQTVETHWSKEPNVFASAHGLGFNAAAVEWFHPTCRVLRGMASCQWWVMALQSNSMGNTFGDLLANQPRSLFETSMLSVFGQSLSAKAHVETYREILQAGIRDATNPKYGFVFIHLPIPHAPHTYDRRTGQFTLANSPINGYTDSLVLLDLTLRKIREAMERTETWDKSTVLITSDHRYRESALLDGKEDPRIPWMLKLAHQRGGAIYSRQFNTVLSQELLLAYLRGEIADPAAAQRWLDNRQTK